MRGWFDVMNLVAGASGYATYIREYFQCFLKHLVG